MGGGWVKLHRQAIKWGWFKVPGMFRVFFYLVMSAAHKDAIIAGRALKAGQLTTGRKELAKETGLSEQQIRTILRRLEDTGEICRKSTSKYSTITIINWETYQGEEGDSQPTINQQSTSNQPHNKNVKNVKKTTKEKNIKKESYDPLKDKPPEIDAEDWSDLVQHRRKVKATETKRAYNALFKRMQEATLEGWTYSECIDEICTRGWRGFRATWMPDDRPKGDRKGSYDDIREQYAYDLLKERAGTTGTDTKRVEKLGGSISGESTSPNAIDKPS